MKKQLLIGAGVGLISSFLGSLVYDLVSKPDGILYLDKDTKSVYAALEKDPDEYKPGSKLIFVFKA